MVEKVLQINVVSGFGSTGRIVDGIDRILNENNIKSYVAFGRGEKKDILRDIKIGSKLDAFQHVAMTRLFDAHGFASSKATNRLIETIRQISPDVIHLHNIHGYYLNIRLLFKYLSSAGVPVVWTFHDMWPVTGHCAYPGDCTSWLSGCKNCVQKNEYPSSYLFDKSMKNYSIKKDIFNSVKNLTIVTPSIWLRRQLEKSFLGNYPILVINNGINLANFHQHEREPLYVKYGIKKDNFVILGVASNFEEERKGFGYFSEISRAVDKNTTIILVGVTKKQLRTLPENIMGIEKTEGLQTLAELYSLADVFCNPTIEDNFPTVNLEAMACGTPVVAFDTGGIKEQITEECGRIVKKGDIISLIDAIYAIRIHGKNKYSNYCIERVNTMYNERDRFRDYLNLYRQLTE